jgi:hypothetical protein
MARMMLPTRGTRRFEMTTLKNVAIGAVGMLFLIGCATHVAVADDHCFYRGTMFSDGSAACQNGEQFRCNDGEWTVLGGTCSPQRVSSSRTCEYDGISYSTGSASCQAGTQFRCEDGSWKSIGAACTVLSSNTIEVRPSGDTCHYEDATVASGSTICKSSSTFLCNDGEWINLGTLCR